MQNNPFSPQSIAMHSECEAFTITGFRERSPNLGLPLHSCHRDAKEQDDGDRADDSDVVEFIRHEGVDTLWAEPVVFKTEHPNTI